MRAPSRRPATAGPSAEELAALARARRALYRRGASAADLQRYEALRAALPEPGPSSVDAAAAAPPSPGTAASALRSPSAAAFGGDAATAATSSGLRRWRIPVAVIAGAGVLVVATALLPGLRPDPAAPAAASAPSASSAPTTAPVLPIGVTERQVLAVPEADRRLLAAALADGADPDLSRYLWEHPASRPRLDGVGRVQVIERRGRGDALVTTDVTGLVDEGGRVTVILMSDRADAVSWAASRPAVRENPLRAYRQTVGAGTVRSSAGRPVAATFAYRGPAPRRLSVSASSLTRWDALVVYTD